MQYPVASNLRALTNDSVQKCSATHLSETLLHSYFLTCIRFHFLTVCSVPFVCEYGCPPSAPPHRALRIHFVGFALLCTHSLQVHSYISDFYERLKKKRFPQCLQKGTLKGAKPWVWRRFKSVSVPLERLHRGGKIRGEAAMCGCLLGREENKM